VTRLRLRRGDAQPGLCVGQGCVSIRNSIQKRVTGLFVQTYPQELLKVQPLDLIIGLTMAEPSDPTAEDTGVVAVPTGDAKRPRAAIRSAFRKLTEKESASPVVVEFLIEDVYRLEAENKRLVAFQDKFHARDKEVAILQSEVNSWQKGDVLYTICIAVGSAFLGGSPSFNGVSEAFLLVACVILVIGALFFRFGWPFQRQK
jgi:hypothetical protein